jgi:hypothetical protein
MKHHAIFIAAIFAAWTGPAEADLVISSQPTNNVSCTAGVCGATAQDAVFNVGDLAAQLASGDVTVASGSLAEDIKIGAALSWASTGRLTLDAYRSISFDKPVVVAGQGALTIATNDGGSAGDFSFRNRGHVEFWDASDSLVINGQSYVLVKNIQKLIRMVKRHVTHIALAKKYNAVHDSFSASPIASFDGTFEGLGNTISNLAITASTGRVGLFGEFGESDPASAIRDIGLLSVNIVYTGFDSSIGALAGDSRGIIANAYATGAVTSMNGGSNIKNIVGGLVGNSGGDAVIRNSYAAVAVSGNSDGDLAGGLAGSAAGACFPGCTGLIYQSYATGAVTGGSNTSVGGLVGFNNAAMIVDSYAVGSVNGGSGARAGGLVGNNADDPNEMAVPVITRSYSTGTVTGGAGSSVGGLIGQDAVDSTNTDAYWDLNSSGVSDPTKGAGNIASDPGPSGLTTTQFQSGLPAGFAKATWHQKAGVNGGYPYLRDVPPR